MVVLTTEKLDDISATETNFLHSFLLLTSADNQISVRKHVSILRCKILSISSALTVSYFAAIMVLILVFQGLKKVLKSLKFVLQKCADTLVTTSISTLVVKS